jgi:hypothetical protein
MLVLTEEELQTIISLDGLSHYHAQSQLENNEKFVAKEAGKGLSSNDYTTVEKNQLAALVAGGIPGGPSVDEIIDGYYNSEDYLFYKDAEFTEPISGESGKLYVDVAKNNTYRFTGTIFTRINPPEFRVATNEEINALFNK